MSDLIGKTSVTLSESWGSLKFYDYTFKVDGVPVPKDFQDLMVAVSEMRAVTVEREVTPMTTRIRARNTYLDQLGDVLSELTKIQAGFDNEASGKKDMSGWITQATANLLINKLGYTYTIYENHFERPGDESRAGFYYLRDDGLGQGYGYSANKMTIEGMIQKVKSTIDGLNNESQTDMSRLQSLVDRRDESYSTATNLMTAISDSRSNLIRNL